MKTEDVLNTFSCIRIKVIIIIIIIITLEDILSKTSSWYLGKRQKTFSTHFL